MAAPKIYCSNPLCKALNPQNHNFCDQCQTPLEKRYLWALSEGREAYQPGEILGDRYFVVDDRIWLDTKPGFLPEMVEVIPLPIQPYLKLSPYRLHIPQVHGLVTIGDAKRNQQIWLLEEVPIYNSTMLAENSGQLMPNLNRVWKSGSALRQLNWLWQIAQLWEPMINYGVASSLLNVESLRVESSLVRLLQLEPDSTSGVTLGDLGKIWSQWAAIAHPQVNKFLEKLSQQMIEGQVATSEHLLMFLEKGLADCGNAQGIDVQLVTYSDKGPTRRRNEDSCYPPSGTSISFASNQPKTSNQPLAIVCDGIGGHEGGDVASNLAIQTIGQRLENLLNDRENLDPTIIAQELEAAACAANDAIGQRNDDEQRLDRQRMGTTLVMAVVHAPWITIAHVGDSRAYRMTSNGCHQVTWDDDIASREVRLGYALYRDAVHQPTGGALVQALGMGSSSILHPNVQRFILDEDCTFLLCSDGLSDNERIDQYWEVKIIRPLKQQQINLPTVGQQLVELANEKNGHDNVTVALIDVRMRQPDTIEQTELSMPQIAAVSPNVPSQLPTRVSAPTQIQSERNAPAIQPTPLLLFAAICFIGLAGGLSFWGISRISSPNVSSTPRTSSPSPATSVASPSPTATLPPELEPGLRIKLKDTRILQRPNSANQLSELNVVRGSVLQVLDKEPQKNDSWLALEVCTDGRQSNAQNPPSPSSANLGQQRQIIWMQQSQFESLIDNADVVDAKANEGNCQPIADSASPNPQPKPSSVNSLWKLKPLNSPPKSPATTSPP